MRSPARPASRATAACSRSPPTPRRAPRRACSDRSSALSAASTPSTPSSPTATRSRSCRRSPEVQRVRDEQVRRYERQIMLPDVGGLGQTAVMVASARLTLRESEPLAELLAGTFLAAAGVGSLVVPSASDSQRADLAAHGPDTR